MDHVICYSLVIRLNGEVMPFTDMQSRDGLLGPASYWNASSEKKARNCNGCGTAGWKGVLIPDSVYGLCVSEACNLHDWMYAIGTSREDKLKADNIFQDNLLALVRRDANRSWIGWLLKIPRSYRCFGYYMAVAESSASVHAFREAKLV